MRRCTSFIWLSISALPNFSTDLPAPAFDDCEAAVSFGLSMATLRIALAWSSHAAVRVTTFWLAGAVADAPILPAARDRCASAVIPEILPFDWTGVLETFLADSLC